MSTSWTATLLQLLLLPYRTYEWIVSYHRPDVKVLETRETEWKALRSRWRWVHGVIVYLGPPSHILWNIKWTVLFNVAVAAAAMSDAVAEEQDIVLNEQVDTAAMLTWRLSSFMLALLMANKVNRVYDRWWLGRQAYSAVGGAAYVLAQQTLTWVEDTDLRNEIIRWCKVWQFSTYGFLNRQQKLHPLVADLFSDEEAAFYAKAPKYRNVAILRLRRLIHRAQLSSAELQQMDQTLNRGIAEQGTVVRLFEQCMPYALTLMASGFLEIWLLLMPFGLFSNLLSSPSKTWRDSAFEMLLYTLINVLMLGVDEVAGQLEQPFDHMPLLAVAKSTVGDISRLVEEAETLEKIADEHMWRLQQQQQQQQQFGLDLEDSSSSAASLCDGDSLQLGGAAARLASARDIREDGNQAFNCVGAVVVPMV